MLPDVSAPESAELAVEVLEATEEADATAEAPSKLLAVVLMVTPAPPTPKQRLKPAGEEQLEYGDNATPWSDMMAFIADA